jgi:hypothetical protein
MEITYIKLKRRIKNVGVFGPGDLVVVVVVRYLWFYFNSSSSNGVLCLWL